MAGWRRYRWVVVLTVNGLVTLLLLAALEGLAACPAAPTTCWPR
ncbi:MAG TPA: hypothetical protein VMT16_06510 [Thermoanaerobaculia bacterium]|nr:hypothetical protein [Thermoanaerobaculia bacterium]